MLRRNFDFLAIGLVVLAIAVMQYAPLGLRLVSVVADRGMLRHEIRNVVLPPLPQLPPAGGWGTRGWLPAQTPQPARPGITYREE